jgi:outer membrane protein assembly factor BamB
LTGKTVDDTSIQFYHVARIGGIVKKLFLLLAAMVLLVSCKKNHAPDVTALSAGPEVCLKDTSYTFTAIATDPDGDSVAVRVDWGDSTVSTWTGWFASGDTIALAHAWFKEGTYKIVAQAKDQKLQSSGWSGAPSTTVVVHRTPALPAAPSGPDRGGQDSTYTFTAAALQPHSIMVAIRFAWGDGDTSDWSTFVASGESVSMGHAWTAPDTYEVTAQAKDTGNAPSLWSAPDSIVIRPPDTLRIWRFLIGDNSLPYITSSPAIGPDGTIYIGSNDSSLYAIRANGTLKWRYPTGGDVQSAPAIAADGTVYVGSDDNHLYALNPEDGTVKWSYLTYGHVHTAPAIAVDGTVYVGSFDDRLYALNPLGTLKWYFPTEGNVESSPAIGKDGTIYVGSDDNYFYVMDPAGILEWRDYASADVRSSPATAADGTIYFGTDCRTEPDFYAVNHDNTIKWTLFGDHVRSSPAIGTDGSIYFGSSDNYLYALNADGTLRWRYMTGGDIDAGPAIAADGTIYFGSFDHCLYAVNDEGTLKWRYETGGDVRSAPTIGPDGTVYFASHDGYLYALKGTSPLADSPWPKFHHDLRNTGRFGGGR